MAGALALARHPRASLARHATERGASSAAKRPSAASEVVLPPLAFGTLHDDLSARTGARAQAPLVSHARPGKTKPPISGVCTTVGWGSVRVAVGDPDDPDGLLAATQCGGCGRITEAAR